MTIFNTEKTAEQYLASRPFLNPEPGLVDTINKKFPAIWDLYKQMRGYDWSEDDITHESALIDFENAPKDTCDMMLKTLMWQWEADSVASRAPTVIIAPFNPAMEIWAAEQRITDNEQIHAGTYSEIVRTGVPNATTVIEQLLAETETFRRLDTVAKTLGEIQHYSRTIALNGVDSEEAALNNLVLFYFTMLVLERIQFMASFAITFTIAESNWFQSIGQAVKLICRDEIEIHCQYRKAVIRAITATPEGKAAYERVKPLMQAILDEVTENELAWTDWLFEGRSLLGTNAKQIKQFVLFAVRDVATFAGLESTHKLPKENPMPFLVKWMDMSVMQAAPQEQDHGQYKFNTVTNDHQDEVFDI